MIRITYKTKKAAPTTGAALRKISEYYSSTIFRVTFSVFDSTVIKYTPLATFARLTLVRCFALTSW
jgi:hypothetical protein